MPTLSFTFTPEEYDVLASALSMYTDYCEDVLPDLGTSDAYASDLRDHYQAPSLAQA